ncbi:MAG: hypothetical protein LUK37_04860 [Clostridia bacterium]|nr:hypothetical protein [Clostridia bacterium]
MWREKMSNEVGKRLKGDWRRIERRWKSEVERRGQKEVRKERRCIKQGLPGRSCSE